MLGKSEEQMDVVAESVGGLREELTSVHPGLNEMSYSIAVDHKIASADQPLYHQAEIALLPPFSGG